MLLHKRSMYNIRPEPSDHMYKYYRTTTDFIKRFVNQAISNTLKIIDNLGELTFDVGSGMATRKLGYFGNEWPTCGSFNSQNGLEIVTNEMESWNALSALKDWMFHVNFLGLQFKNTIEIYTYQILWSVPTPVYPEPQVTVSVYFYIGTSHIYPPHYPVDVTYVFEGHQFTHSLNMIFRAKWLYDILDMKTMMFQTFDF
ncbi:PREDICTED: A-kinase anchor protein 14-like [Eufriesea mexicana]|uniref:A-kinase anchor protein 14-like n=1 Tax=Eufriesea mexicana TaxID=516756 RepID=UPI00083C0C8C|nr:PREDICTED: A-kinase anchor protein 14-like [Eufriesea mexicana]